MAILQRSQSRDGARVIWLAVHSTEGKDNPKADDARALRDATWWPSSAHAIADDEPGTLLSGPEDGLPSYDRASWTLRGGNPYSDNIELVATAVFTRAQWLGQPRLLDLCARWLADRHKARPWIPLRHLTVDEVRRRVPGVIGHWDYTRATGDGDHWDPGPDFPWDVVLAKANQYARGGAPAQPEEEDDMSKTTLIVKVVGKLYLVDFAAGTALALHPAQYGLLKQRGEVDIVPGDHGAEMLTGLRDPGSGKPAA